MSAFVLHTKLFGLKRGSGLRGLGLRLRKIQKEALHAMGEEWVREFLPSHFTPNNRTRYRMESRNRLYLDVIKKRKGQGQGRFVDLILSGRSRRWLLAFARVTSTSERCTVTMRPPTYFTNPFVGAYRDPKTGRIKRIRRQPDKVRELKELPAGEREQLVKIARREYVNRVKAAVSARESA